MFVRLSFPPVIVPVSMTAIGVVLLAARRRHRWRDASFARAVVDGDVEDVES